MYFCLTVYHSYRFMFTTILLGGKSASLHRRILSARRFYDAKRVGTANARSRGQSTVFWPKFLSTNRNLNCDVSVYICNEIKLTANIVVEI